jgi:hypothetical protein
MPFRLLFSDGAEIQKDELENPALQKRRKAVLSALGKLQNNPRHPSLNTHKYSSMTGNRGEDVFEAYAENNTPGA